MSSGPDPESPLDGPLWGLVRASSVLSGPEFFRELTKNLAFALEMRVAVVSELVNRERIRCLSVWSDSGWSETREESVVGTPCGAVIAKRRTLVAAREVRALFPDDERLRHWEIESYVGVPLTDSTDRVIGLLCVMGSEPLADEKRTVTIMDTFASRTALELDRIHTVRELDGQRTFLRQVLDMNPSLIFAKDRDGRFTLVNQAIADVYGTTIDNLTGRTDADFNTNADEVAFFRKMDLEVMDTGQERRIAEEPLTDADGRLRWVQTIKRPIVDADGETNQVLGVATEITEFKRTREELLERQKREQHKVQAELQKVKEELVRQTRLAAIGQVAASIAHELRNPLGAINNSIFFLTRHYPGIDKKGRRHLEMMGQEVLASDRIVTNLLEMSRAKEPAKIGTELAVTVREVFERVAETFAVKLSLSLEPEGLTVRADPEQLRQVLNNLMINAAQSMPEGGTIRVEGRRERDQVTLMVRDDGTGIAPDIRADVFEPLFTTKAKGTGLGLAICRQIVERHNGTIRLLPSKRGAAFEIRLPDS